MAKRKISKSNFGLFDYLGDIFLVIYKDLKENIISEIPKFKKKLEKELKLASRKVLGQRISLIGPPAVGKTSLLKVLRNPNIEKSELENYKKTGAGEEYSGFDVLWNVPIDEITQIEYKFKVKTGLDNGGEDYIREGHWLEAIKDSGIIFYLFDFERYINPQTKQDEVDRIQKDFDWIGEHVNTLKANFVIIPVGNKVDTLCKTLRDFRQLQVDKRESLEGLRNKILESIPKGYQKNIQPPVLMSLFDKKIRNEQFADLMLAVIGKDLVTLIKEFESFKKDDSEAA